MRSILLLVIALFACGPKERASLIAAENWTAVPLSEDPYASFHPGTNACPPTGYGLEDLGGENSLYIDAQDCAYLTVAQPAAVEVDEGDRIRVRIWHFALVALDAATATIAMTVNGHSVFEAFVPIPSEGALLPDPNLRMEADFESDAGAPVLFHLRNHGTNSYNLIELSRGGE